MHKLLGSPGAVVSASSYGKERWQTPRLSIDSRDRKDETWARRVLQTELIRGVLTKKQIKRDANLEHMYRNYM
ncbi:hypothetical protein BaRGS_00006612 [Batillaria attramentaria]|uniref:Uncharacterized protein n=1 Tax=Batillaria attramentaria TaxID=370345 RepID=A0ABD0LT09_9CAEN